MTKKLPNHLKKIADKGAPEAFIKANVGYNEKNCLEWPFGKNKAGYGLATIDRKQSLASRWMCFVAYGRPPTSQHEAAHSCNNPGCVNPKHLRWDTRQGNQADRVEHGTHNFGERNGKTRLNADDVHIIRNDSSTAEALALRYNVSKRCIWAIKRGTRWI